LLDLAGIAISLDAIFLLIRGVHFFESLLLLKFRQQGIIRSCEAATIFASHRAVHINVLPYYF
jgi:hypothetical protein